MRPERMRLPHLPGRRSLTLAAMNARKKLRLVRSLLVSALRPSAPFVRVIPTDACNLACRYCWQRDADEHRMSRSLFERCLERALALDAGVLSFLGGEPTLWPELLPAIALCTRAHLATDLTTNGTTLSAASLAALEAAGLDMLNVSVDGLAPTPESRKCALGRPGVLEAIRAAHRRGRLRVRVNAVVGKHNVALVRELIAVAAESGVAISVGFVTHRPGSARDPDVHFGPSDLDEVRGFARHVQEARRRGARIIDPDAYFHGYARFLAGERFWRCNYATRRGWINVDPRGFVRDCTKKLGRLPWEFADLYRAQLPAVRAALAAGVEACNASCYSNCAFDGAYYARHKLRLLGAGIS